MEKIYVVDEDERIGELLKKILENYDYHVVKFKDSEHTPEQMRRLEADRKTLIRSQLNRSVIDDSEEIMSVGSIMINQRTREVRIDHKLLELTYKEYELLIYLIKNSKRVVAREELLNTLWGQDYNRKSRTLDIHIKTLRRKMGNVGVDHIKTIRSVGYRFVMKDVS